MVWNRITKWLRPQPAEAPKPDERPFVDELIHVRVGSDERPACYEDIKQVGRELRKCLKQGNRILVTHHAVDISTVKLAKPVYTDPPRKRKRAESDDASILDTILQDQS